MKVCTKCGVDKPLTEFNRDGKALDGLRTRCRECVRAQSAGWRARHPDAWRTYMEAHRTEYAAYARQHKLRHPTKRAAREALHYAVVVGRVIRPSTCPACGRTGRIEGHHDDYSRPLDVQWLCSRCHKALHFRLREEARAAA